MRPPSTRSHAGTDDADEDGVPDACDVCADADDTIDGDEDGVPDGCDLCADADDTVDEDEDGVPDGCDECPGLDETLDLDEDGTPFRVDGFPWDGATLYAVARSDANLHTLDTTTGEILTTTAIVDGGEVLTLTGSTGMCTNPLTNDVYVVMKIDGGERQFGTLDVATGAFTLIGALTESVAGLGCATDGTVYAVTGQSRGGANPTSLFTVNTEDGTETLAAALADVPDESTDGEAIAWDATTNLLYRRTGDDPYYFGSIDPLSGTEVEIAITGEPENECTAMTTARAWRTFASARPAATQRSRSALSGCAESVGFGHLELVETRRSDVAVRLDR